MESIQNEKNRIRAYIKEQKKNIAEKDQILCSGAIFNQVEQLSAFNEAENILVYWSIPGEVHTHNFIMKWLNIKNIILPVVMGDLLELRRYTGKTTLETSQSFGIMEPVNGDLVTPDKIDFAIIPGVAFDSKGNRLGRGKGFYDRLLNDINALKVGVGFRFQLLKSVPVEPYDIPVDLIITN